MLYRYALVQHSSKRFFCHDDDDDDGNFDAGEKSEHQILTLAFYDMHVNNALHIVNAAQQIQWKCEELS